MNDVERFFSKVDVHGENECWPWRGCVSGRYGLFWFNGRNMKAHRFSWEFANNKKIPAKLCACHSCDNPVCVNPKHIWIGTAKENMQDALRKGRLVTPPPEKCGYLKHRTHCPRGHAYSGDNLMIHTTKRWGKTRKCRTCVRASQKKYQEKIKKQANAQEKP